MTAIDTVLHTIDRRLDDSIKRLFALLRFASVATDPAHDADCRNAARWLRDYFAAMGLTAAVHETTGQPVVTAVHEPPGAAIGEHRHLPHVLFYGHYDVQPADPLELWTTPPFEPRIGKGKSGRECIYARGVADDKGQVMTFVEASRAWLDVHGSLPFRLTILIEGDEEGDPSHLDRFVAANRATLKADIALVCDTSLWDEETPSIVTSLRGLIAEDVTVKGPRIDLHSGYYGGPAANPIKALSRVLGRMHDDRGRIAIPGFYQGVKAPSAAVRRAWKKVPFSTPDFLGRIGLKTPAGETGFTALEQMWVRPTAEINGIWGGYTGPGGKTVLPATASAKVTFRLVQGQHPAKIRRAFRKFVRDNLPKDCTARFAAQGGDAAAIAVPEGSTWIAAGLRALADEWGRPAVVVGEGGSIPVVESFRKHLGLDSLMMGWCNEDDALHSPNEKYNIESYHKGTRAWARLINEIAKET